MNTDIRVKTSFPNHPKTIKLISLIGDLGPWLLIKLWLFAAQNKTDGILVGMKQPDICRAMGYRGDPRRMISALKSCAFISKHESGWWQLHDWKEHNPYVYTSPLRVDRARKGALALWEKKRKQSLTECPKHEQAMLLAQDSNAPAPAPAPAPLAGAGVSSTRGNGNGQSVDAMGRPLKVFK
jgi:hypothetical protein